MKHIFLFALLFGSVLSFGQENFNLELVGQLDIPEGANDVWGFTASDGKEYALVGTRQAAKIVDISDPSNPIMIDSIGGQNTTWRDLKVWDDYIYVTSDGTTEGLLIIDARDMSQPLPYTYWQDSIIYDGINYGPLEKAHNIFIDDKGHGYLAGSNIGARGVLILDLNSADKFVPEVIGIENFEYAHDVFVKDNLMYASEIYAGSFTIYDISDPADIKFLATQETTSNFTHNAWTSDDGKYIYTTDEKPNSFVDAYDISDMNEIKRLDVFRPLETAGSDVVPHNTHFLNDYLITSWYTEGVVVTDVSRPHNMVKVGAYDTWPESHGMTRGCWGAFPYLDSGLVLATDRAYGLFIFQPNYQRACYLEGNITDYNTGGPVNNVEIAIVSPELSESASNATGDYATGIANAGEFDVVFTHPDYTPITKTVNFENGILNILDIVMGDPLSVLETGASSKISITPNPYIDKVQLQAKAKIKHIHLYGMDGRLICEFLNVNSNEKTLNLNHHDNMSLLFVTYEDNSVSQHKVFSN